MECQGLGLRISNFSLAPLFAHNYLVGFWDFLKFDNNVFIDFISFVVCYEVHNFLVVICKVYYYYRVSFVRLRYQTFLSQFFFDLIDKF
jgi:hypothetical protein